MKDLIPWPGNQLNDINIFRNKCFKKCHEENPTDSGWYEKTNECGRQCFHELQNFQKSQGKNPCAQRLQAPVFWFNNGSKEDFIFVKTPPQSVSRYHIILIVLVFCVILSIIIRFRLL